MKKILIADDEPRMLRLIEDFLSSEYDITTANDGKEALQAFYKDQYDLAILDIMMPNLSGLEVLEEIRKTSQVPVIFLTAKTTELDELTGFLSGADEYIKKPFSPSILRARVQVILKRGAPDPSTDYGLIEVDEPCAQVKVNGELLNLTTTEYKLLLYFLKNNKIVMSRDHLLNAVWGEDYFGTDRTVDTTINRLRIKLGPASYYIDTVRGIGYKFEVIYE